MVNIIHICFWINQLNQIFDDFNDIFLREDTHVHISRQIQFLVDSVTTYITKVISFFWEEQVVDNFTCTCIIGRIGVTQLTIDIQHSFFFRVTRVLLQSIIYNREIRLIRLVLMQKDVLNSRFQNFINMYFLQYGFTVDNNLVTFDRNHFTGIFINEIFNPCFQNTCS